MVNSPSKALFKSEEYKRIQREAAKEKRAQSKPKKSTPAPKNEWDRDQKPRFASEPSGRDSVSGPVTHTFTPDELDRMHRHAPRDAQPW